MSKTLVLQALYSLSDEGCEFQIRDRLSFQRLQQFQRFPGLGLAGTVPDATTVWLFRERLVKARAIDRPFARFDAALKERGYLAMGGQILDATIVPAPRQRNTGEDKGTVRYFVREAGFVHQTMNLSPKIMANRVLASHHSRGGRIHSAAA